MNKDQTTQQPNEPTTEQSSVPRTWLEAVEFAEKSGLPITIVFYKGQKAPELCCTKCGGNVVALPAGGQ
jgi:hypothetical protein